jgi:hypothetical protein
VSHRTQITLTDSQYQQLRTESEQTGRSLSELVRRALDNTYGGNAKKELLEAIDASFGLWSDRELDGEAYVDSMRHGLGSRVLAR